MRARFPEQKVLKWVEGFIARLWFSFIYTCTIFFPLFLKIDKIKYRHKLMVFYIFLVYTAGLVCVGYMANFVVQK